ncbi:DUF2293 domain-containing protein [Mangrovicella endophytica]|uniref:DUF2293 domain-containing protein n=1 Tax=Mangrovicella endophytica TaxID=2066697 RepID=UPI000C9E63FD|nr:DUF2293 domain-containing protein [Mangrovicella endophytica]
MATERQKAIARALTATIPRAPFIDAEAIRQAARAKHLRDLSPATALWLAAVAHIRHAHTDYDELMDEGYGRDAARFFVLDDINAVLDRWGSTRQVSGEEALETEPASVATEDEDESEDEPD